MSSKNIKLLIPILLALVIWFIPAPEGLSQEAWRFFGIFLAVIIGLILEPVPAALVGFTGISVVALLGLMGNSSQSIQWALSGFSNTTIWLIFAAFMFAAGYKKTGLGKRISLLMVKYMGKSTLGLGYAVAFSDLVLAPFMPSNTARSGGTIYPVAINIPQLFGSLPDNEPRKIGAYISWVAIASTCVTSSMFITALAPNVLAVGLVEKNNIIIAWIEWAKIMLPLMIPLFLLTPWLTYVVYPPTQKKSPEAPAWAAEELKKLGGVTFKEYLMLGLAVTALILWIFGKELGINGTTAAICVVSVMILTGVITWDDLLSDKAAFNVFIWFATLVALANGLNKVGLIQYLNDNVSSIFTDMSLTSAILILIFLFYILHYFFASTTAHVTALVPVFIAVSAQIMSAEQLLPFTILLLGSLGVMGIITPYGCGPSPIWYGAGYITQARWWSLGALFGAIYLIPIIIGVFIFI
ncbi:anion permease [Aliarcobacter skirrowii]|uniref:Anion permease n=1 Tax=Aliarcobacter skirrowii TaxID=28200 RepID=A0A2U2C227_9BACT|nr:anion permease [Aliarcobacter skirrowii]PWE20773.1 anion permease [Aliarcobacter skirrowii]PWE22385.1 anion permease [Aliarcobacter skirrowii]PWE25607.1 anion permease [Aliarcobacter skirrowii]RJO55937.1 anion permease [Aliarcobacter skirrowii]RJO57810.1 anion permease [Aliarcobacter skirrowii]